MSETITLPASKTTAASATTLDAIAFTGNGSFQLVATIGNTNNSGLLSITGTVGAAALTGFKLTRAVVPGGTHKDWLSDTDFNTATTAVPQATTNLYTTASEGTFQLVIDTIGSAEIKVYAKAASNSSLALEVGYVS